MRRAFPRRGMAAPTVIRDGAHHFRKAHLPIWRDLRWREQAGEIRDLTVHTTQRGLANAFSWTDARSGQPQAQSLTTQKYGAQRVQVDGHTFDSKHEARVYEQLRARHAAGEIANLELHPVYPFVINGVKVGRFTPDFRYVDLRAGGRLVVADAKSSPTKTEAYGLRKRLLLALYDIELLEV